jgi:hypothetical protein
MYSKDDFLGSNKRTTKKKEKSATRKQSLYEKCYSSICNFSNNAVIINLLDEYLKIRLAMKDKPIYGIAQWTSLLSKLIDLVGDNTEKQAEIIKQSIEHGWASFYPLSIDNKHYPKKDVFSEGEGISCEQCTTTAEERKEILRKMGYTKVEF